MATKLSGSGEWAAEDVQRVVGTQDERTKDAKEAGEKYEKLLGKMLEMQTGMSKAIDAVTAAENAGTAVSREQNVALDRIRQTLDTTIRDAIRDSRRGYREEQSIRPQPQQDPPTVRREGDPPPRTPGGTKRFGRY